MTRSRPGGGGGGGGAVRCGAVRCGAVRRGAVRCGAARCGAARCGAVGKKRRKKTKKQHFALFCIGSTSRIGRESWCLPYAGFFYFRVK